MKLETTQITKLTLSELERLDPVSVMLEDIEPRKGKITIECYGEAWCGYWDNMGELTVAEFFCWCGEQYLVEKLINGDSENNSEYLCRIINAVKDALLAYQEQTNKLE